MHIFLVLRSFRWTCFCVAEGGEAEGEGAEGEGGDLSEENCVDRDGAAAVEGALYKPYSDPCIECTCREGRPTRCMAVSCRPPNCEWERLEGQCCQFRCLDASDDSIAAVPCAYPPSTQWLQFPRKNRLSRIGCMRCMLLRSTIP